MKTTIHGTGELRMAVAHGASEAIESARVTLRRLCPDAGLRELDLAARHIARIEEEKAEGRISVIQALGKTAAVIDGLYIGMRARPSEGNGAPAAVIRSGGESTGESTASYSRPSAGLLFASARA